MMTLQSALVALNEYAYMAAKLARKDGSPLAERLKAMALDTDAMVDGSDYANRLDLHRIDEIDSWFQTSTGWGSWMVAAANEREAIVNRLNRNGLAVQHKHLARTGDGKSVS